MLVYEPGGFFAAHRDTEKGDGMIAMLTVSLPAASAGSGGGLLVRHGEGEVRVDTAVSEPSELAWAAFYADCLHETRPNRCTRASGCLWCSTYAFVRTPRTYPGKHPTIRA